SFTNTPRTACSALSLHAALPIWSLLWHAGLLSDATSTSAQDAERASASTAAEALAGLATAPSGLHGLDLTRVTPGDDTRWWEAVAPSSRFFDFVVTDWGVRDVGSLGHVATASSLLAIVLTPDREALQRTVEIAAAAHAARGWAAPAPSSRLRNASGLAALRLAAGRVSVAAARRAGAAQRERTDGERQVVTA